MNRCRMLVRIGLFLGTVLYAALFGAPGTRVSLAAGQDAESEPSVEEELDSYDFREIEQAVEESMGQAGFRFADLVRACLEGETDSVWQLAGAGVEEALWGELKESRALVWQVFLWAVGGALFLVLAKSLSESSVADMGYMVLYMGMMALLLTGFRSAIQAAGEGLRRISGLLQVFLPVLFLAVAVQGQITAAAMYETSMMLLGGMVWLYETVILPGIRLWVPLRLVEGILPEDLISRLTGGMKRLLSVLIKTAFGAAVGLQAVQALITPYLDAVKGGALVRLASAIPGIGNSIGEAARMALGTAALVRNGIGAGGLIVMLTVSAGPVCRLLFYTLLYHGLAACIQPFSDKRLTGAVSGVGEGCLLLLKALGGGVICFAIVIGLACTCLKG